MNAEVALTGDQFRSCSDPVAFTIIGASAIWRSFLKNSRDALSHVCGLHGCESVRKICRYCERKVAGFSFFATDPHLQVSGAMNDSTEVESKSNNENGRYGYHGTLRMRLPIYCPVQLVCLIDPRRNLEVVIWRYFKILLLILLYFSLILVTTPLTNTFSLRCSEDGILQLL